MGGKYVGTVKENEPHGFGELSFLDGGKYVGKIKNAVFHGKGKFYDANGKLMYEGEWKKGKLHG